MLISTSFISVILALARVALAHPVLVMVSKNLYNISTDTNSPVMQQPEFRTIRVPGLMRKVRDVPMAPAGLDFLSALPLESLLGVDSSLTGDGSGGGGDGSNGSEEYAGSSGYGPADGGADDSTGNKDSSDRDEDRSNTNEAAANGKASDTPASDAER